jgi:hypothetical protein
MELLTYTLDKEEWDRIRRALIIYSASLEPDKSEAAHDERLFALALQADIKSHFR